jgi:hypothetical protein
LFSNIGNATGLAITGLPSEVSLNACCSLTAPSGSPLSSTPAEQLGLAGMQFDPCRVSRNPRRRPRLHQRELAERFRREGTLVDVGDHLAPFVEDLRGVVAPLDLRHIEDHRRLVVDCDPGLEIGDVEVGIDEIGRAQRVVLDLVVGEVLRLAVHLFLANDQRTTEQIDIGVGDGLRVGSRWLCCGLRRSDGRHQ